MKKTLLVVCFLFGLLATQAQTSDNWQVIYNNRVVFRGTADEEIKATSLRGVRLKTSDNVTLKYNTDNSMKGWKRTFYINDSNDKNLKTIEMNEQSGSVTVNATVLNDLIKNKQPAFIYTMSLPKDKAQAARIRVRRILLCKIDWN